MRGFGALQMTVVIFYDFTYLQINRKNDKMLIVIEIYTICVYNTGIYKYVRLYNTALEGE